MKIYNKDLEEILTIVRAYTVSTVDEKVEQSVCSIIEAVVRNGDAALRTYTKQFDGIDVADFKVDSKVLEEAYESLDDDIRDALAVAKKNITRFHERQVEQGFIDMDEQGIVRGQKVIPFEKVGIYVPGGTAAYPSTVMMCALPAKIAGVERIIMVTPPQKDGLNPVVLGAAYMAGVTEVYQIGGAQAIAALAYGTESIPKVDSIVGPGNIFVATAKRQVYGRVTIDMIAGPSEIGIIADDTANPKVVAADLLSQAEHDPRARSILVTNSEDLARAVSAEVELQLQVLPRESIARTAIEENSYIALATSVEDMFTIMNEVAPEHLEIQMDNALNYMSYVKHAGSVFLGAYAGEPLGDYVGGANHVLPTSGTARFSSPLGVYDFVKRTSFMMYDEDQLKKVAPAITTLARAEGLEGHARSIEARLID